MEEVREKRVGTFTLGCILVIFGVLYLLSNFVKSLSYEFILHLWPLVLICFGVEILVMQLDKKAKIKLDMVSILMMFLIMGGASVMGAIDFVMTHHLCL